MDNKFACYYIYKITNKINGKNYIGKRKCPLSKTPWTDTKYLGGGSIIKSSEKKYGVENFSKEIIAICYNPIINCILEKQYIKLYREIGKAEYNIASGGEGGHGPTSEITKLTMSKRLKGRKLSKEHCKHISESKIGKSAKNKGTKWYNNGEISIMTNNPPEGFVPGVINKNCLPQEEWQSRYDKIKLNEEIAKVQEQERKEREKESYSNKSSHWYTNGVINTRAKECPEGFWYGRSGVKPCSEETKQKKREIEKNLTPEQRAERSRKISAANTGRHFTEERKKHIGDGNRGRKYFNNGEIEVMRFECPPGFVPGRCPKSKANISKGMRNS